MSSEIQFTALTFDYSIKKLQEVGRSWSNRVYVDKENIFNYSAASYASFLHHNPDAKLTIFTDDPDFLKKKVNDYNVDQRNVTYVDWTEQLIEYKQDKYAFRPLIELVAQFRDSKEYVVKLDNDLISKKPFSIKSYDDVLVWKFERFVANGDPRWGEKLVCLSTIGTCNFNGYNVGVLGLPTNFWQHYDEYQKVVYDMINVDISKVTDVNSKIWHCCEQTAYNWLFHKHKFKIVETNNIFDHHFENKNKCIEAASFLRKDRI